MRKFDLTVDCHSGDVKFVAINDDSTTFEFSHVMGATQARAFAEQMKATLEQLASLSGARGLHDGHDN